MAIQSFKCNHTQKLFEGEQPKRFKNIETVAERKLQMLDSAVELKDLRAPPANRLEALKGNREGQHSIRLMTNGAFVLGGLTQAQPMLK
jgi:proteic killer suppression protein